jgi:uncharacterized membrane protein YfcA
MSVWLVYAAAGCTAGFLAGLLGIGGGLVVVPALVFAFTREQLPAEIALQLAFGTSMASVLFTSASSLRAHHARGAVLWRIVRWAAPGIVAGGFAGATLSTVLPAAGLRLALALYMTVIACQMLLGLAPALRRRPLGPTGIAAAGGVIGAVSGMVGLGGAVLTVPLLSWCGVQFRQAVGTAAAIGFPVAAAGTVGFVLLGALRGGLPPLSLGFVHLPALAAIVAPSVLLAPVGARCQAHVPVPMLKRLFAGVLLVLAFRLAV